jgi:anti-sigma B factor antagonist
MDEVDDVAGREPTGAQFAVDVTRRDDGAMVVAFRGELDLSVAKRARDAVNGAIATAPTRLVYDLGALTFMDSSGLAILLESAERVAVEVRCASAIVARLLETTGVAGVVHFDGTRP